jgi:hypothetical protein
VLPVLPVLCSYFTHPSELTAAGHLHAANRCVAMLSKMFNLAVCWQSLRKAGCRRIPARLADEGAAGIVSARNGDRA